MHLRIAIIGNAASTMVRFRGPLIWALQALGHEVVAICLPGTPEEGLFVEERESSYTSAPST